MVFDLEARKKLGELRKVFVARDGVTIPGSVVFLEDVLLKTANEEEADGPPACLAALMEGTTRARERSWNGSSHR